MKRILLLTVCTVFAAEGYAEEIFKLGKKSYQANDLSPATQQSLYDIEIQRYRQIKAASEAEILDIYFSEQAKKSGKSKEEIEMQELKTKDPSDKDIKKFYNENKAKIPPSYTYDQIKPEIKRILSGKQKGEKRQKLLEKIQKSKGFKFSLKEPNPPTIKINTAGFPSKGKPNSKISIVEFADYQCPHCKHASEAFKQLLKTYSSKVQFTYIDFPINRSGISRTVAEGAFCAKKQNKYWEYHTMAFDKQSSLTKDSPKAFAKTLKLNVKDFEKCLGSAEAKTFVSKGKNEGTRVGVSGTPTIYINGKKYTAAHDYKALKEAVDKLL